MHELWTLELEAWLLDGSTKQSNEDSIVLIRVQVRGVSAWDAISGEELRLGPDPSDDFISPRDDPFAAPLHI